MPITEKKSAESVATQPVNPCLREIAVEVPAETVAREMESLLAKYTKLARLPGFRKGKAPATIIRQRFAEELRSDVIEQLVPRFFREEVQRQKLEPISQPHVTNLEMQEGQPLRFKASFEVMPPIEVSGYQELRPEKAEVKVTDADVDEELEHIRQQRAKFITVEGTTLAEGDFAEVPFTGKPQEEANKPISVDDAAVQIGGNNSVLKDPVRRDAKLGA